MTETSLLPGMTAAEQTAVVPPADIDDAGVDRRRLFAIGGVAGAVVLAVAAFFLLHHGSSPTTTTLAGMPHHVVPPAGSSAGQGTTASTSTKLPKAAKHSSEGRDPFKALVVAPPAASSNTGPTTTVTGNPTTTTTTTTNTQPSGPVTGNGTTPTTTGTTPAPPASPSQGGSISSLGTPQWIQLVATTGDKSAMFKVGYRHHKFHLFKVSAPKPGAQQGTVFDGEFALIGIQDNAVTLQVGDATPFDLPTGMTRQL